MTKRNQKKCTLYFQVTNSIDFDITPSPLSIRHQDTMTIYDIMVDVDCVNLITVNINYRDNNAHIILKRIELNGVEISDINAISHLHTVDGEIRKNHGYIDAVGEFLIKIHTNAVSQNYLSYLISLTK
jgi:hypothetical protein